MLFNQNNLGNGVWAMMQKETAQWMAFSTTTGQLLWTGQPETVNHMYGVSGGIYNGILYSGDASGTGGHVYAYNVQLANLFSITNQPQWVTMATGHTLQHQSLPSQQTTSTLAAQNTAQDQTLKQPNTYKTSTH